MKHERLRTGLTSVVLAMAMAVGSAGCLISVFQLPIADSRKILLLWFLGAVLHSTFFLRRNGGYRILCFWALAAGYLWHRGIALRQLNSAILQVSLFFDDAYQWGVPLFAFSADRFGSVDFPAAIWGLLMECAVCRSVCGRRSTAPALFLSLFTLTLILFLPDANPPVWILFLLLSGLGMLVLTGYVRRESAAQGNRLTFSLLIPVLAAAGGLLLMLPHDSYVDYGAPVRESLSRYAIKLPEKLTENRETALFSPQELSRNKVDLSALRGQDPQNAPVMTVTSRQTGTVYLRGQDYDVYTGLGWESTEQRAEDFSGWGEQVDRITLHTYGRHAMLYFPYFPDRGTILSGGGISNTNHLTDYTVSRYAMGSASTQQSLIPFLALPETTAQEARALLPEEHPAPEVIGDIVRSSAAYDRSTGQMPQEEPDFVLWFLREADTGYCVHFASAAAVLLRAAGIPARYVTGYKAETVSGETVTVSALDAHAWAEYYDSDMGSWRILEATPPDYTSAPAAPTEPVGEEAPAILPEETEPITEVIPQLTAVERRTAAVIGTAFAGGVILLLILRRWLRHLLRIVRRRKASVNPRALVFWQEAEALTRALKTELPEELSALAQKARFSQHTLTPDELAPFGEFCRECLDKVKKKPWYLRFYCKYILAIC